MTFTDPERTRACRVLLALLGAVVTWVAEPPACGQAADPAVLPPPVALPR